MAKTSAGLLMYRTKPRGVEVLLVHPGGPFWTKKDDGAWFVPKGELDSNEEPLNAALREFEEETGLHPSGPFTPLGEAKHKSGKTVKAWAFEGDWDASQLRSNTFMVEWPPKSGRQQEFPEVDKASFFSISEAKTKIHDAEKVFLDRILESLGFDPKVEANDAKPVDQGTLF